jgi:hypothetical protein
MRHQRGGPENKQQHFDAEFNPEGAESVARSFLVGKSWGRYLHGGGM